MTTDDTFSTTYYILEMESLRNILREEAGPCRKKSFSSFLILRLPSDDISQLTRHRRLKEVLLQELDKHRLERVRARVLFSRTYYQALFRVTLSHFSRIVDLPFDFVRASRIDDLVEDSFKQHLYEFLYLAHQRYTSYTLLTPYVASCLLLDIFPPRMHSKNR